MSQQRLTIGALSALTQCNIPTIRYYEQIGLLPPAQRAANGHRYYRDEEVRKLIFVKRCRDFGFPIEQIRRLVQLLEDGDRTCAEVRDLVQLNLGQVRTKLEEMRQLEQSLAAFIDSCTPVCSIGAVKDCTIIEDLSTLDIRPAGGSASCCGTSKPPNEVLSG